MSKHFHIHQYLLARVVRSKPDLVSIEKSQQEANSPQLLSFTIGISTPLSEDIAMPGF
jgi:hypothetical protein